MTSKDNEIITIGGWGSTPGAPKVVLDRFIVNGSPWEGVEVSVSPMGCE
jgi:hypothetical protein